MPRRARRAAARRPQGHRVLLA